MAPGKNPVPPQKGFDPFKAMAGPGLSGGSKRWLWATVLQALCTGSLLGLAKVAEGRPWEHHARAIVLLGIVATWSLALRAIRARLVELMMHWSRASRGLLQRASESGRHLIPVPLSKAQDLYIKGSIRRLRIIAAGLTIPFFVMPMVWSFCSVALSFRFKELGATNIENQWIMAAMFTLFSALVVAGYFHWAILPLPAPVRVSGTTRRFPLRRR